MTTKSKIFFLNEEKKIPDYLKELGELTKNIGMAMEFPGQIPELSKLEKESVILLVSQNFYEENSSELDYLSENAFLILYLSTTGQKPFDAECFDGVINPKNDPREYIPWLNTLGTLSKKLTTDKMNRLYELTSSKLERIKKIHEKVVPLRIERSKNLVVLSKYAAGTSRGGDFYDLTMESGKLTLLMCTTSSYITSTVITSHFLKIQEVEPSKDTYEDLLEDLINECRDLELIKRDQPDMLELMLLSIDLKKLSYFGYQFGRFQCLSTNGMNNYEMNEFPLNENYVEECAIEGKLLPGEKLCLLSPGIFKNLGRPFDGADSMNSTTSKDYLNNIFFNLKKSNNFEDFLIYDSTAAIIEVSPNVLVQI